MMEWLDSIPIPNPCPRFQIQSTRPTTSIQAERVRVGVKRSISKSYNRKCSLALGVFQFFPALIFFIYGHVTGFIRMDYKENATFAILLLSTIMLLIAVIRPVYSVVLATMIFSFISIPLPFACLKGNSINYGRHYGGHHIDVEVANAWIGFQCILSITAFSICCQAFCCGTHGFTEIPRDTINNMETPRDTVNNIVNPRDIVNNMATPRNTMNMVNLRSYPTASEVTASIYATQDNETNQANETNRANETNDKEAGFSQCRNGSSMETRLVVNLVNDETSSDAEGLPSYQQAITNNV